MSHTASPVGLIDEPSAEVTAAFISWMDRHNIQRRKCALGTFPGTGRGVVATENIDVGEIVVEVPDDMALLAESSDLGDTLEAMRLVKGRCSHFFEVQALVLTVMVERLRGADSRWAPYLAALPENFAGLPFTWSREDRLGLRHTSAMHYELAEPAVDPPAQVQTLFKRLILPFFKEFPGHSAGKTREQLWQTFRWATAAVSAYSFELGDEKFQAMVPFWDMLNHVTGAANVRLNHDAAAMSLQMIATAPIAAGAELVNSYGALGNGELLWRHGFIEGCPAGGDALRRVAAAAALARGPKTPYPATVAPRLWRAPNAHDAAVLPLSEIVRAVARHGGLQEDVLLRAKLQFLQRHGIIPQSQRYKISAAGELPAQAAETCRVLCLGTASFAAFDDRVSHWRPGMPRPLHELRHALLGAKLKSLWLNCLIDAVVECRANLCPPSESLLLIEEAEAGSQAKARLEASACVSIGEWCALDRCLHRLAGAAAVSRNPEIIAFWGEATPETGGADAAAGEGRVEMPCVGNALGHESTEDLCGTLWLLQLSKECWKEPRQGEGDESEASRQGGCHNTSCQDTACASSRCGTKRDKASDNSGQHRDCGQQIETDGKLKGEESEANARGKAGSRGKAKAGQKRVQPSEQHCQRGKKHKSCGSSCKA